MPPVTRLVLTSGLVVLLTVARAEADHTSCVSTEALSCGVASSRSLGAAGETACFTFTGEAQEVVSVTTAGGSGLFLPCWTLFDPSGTRVGFPTACGQQERTLPATGTYTIKVFDNNHGETGSYTLSLEVVSSTSGNCGEPIGCGETLQADIGVSDNQVGETDAFTFAGEAGEVVSITTAGGSGLFLPCWALFDPGGTRLGFAPACGQQERTLPATGTYTIKVFDNNHGETGSYTLSLEVVSGTSGNCGEPIGCGETLQADIGVIGETDTFVFAGEAGEVVSLTTAGGSGLFLPSWALFGPNGARVGFSISFGSGERALPVTGTYTVKVFDNNHSETGNYTVTLEVVSGVGATCGEPIACGETTRGAIDAIGETDTFAFAAEAGEVVSVTTAGGMGLFLPCWILFAPDGTRLGFTACGQEERRLPSAGAYTIKVFDNNNGETGDYTIGLEVVSDTASACAEPIACGGTLAGHINVVGETDTFTFPAEGGDVVSIATTGTSALFLPCWELFAPDGTEVGLSLACGPQERTLPTTGNYTVKILDNNNREAGAYELTVRGCGTITTTTTTTVVTSTTALLSYELHLTLRKPPTLGVSFDELGRAVALAGDAVLLGAPHDETGAPDGGAVYVVSVEGGSTNPSFGVPRTLLAPAPTAGDMFGAAVASVEGHVLVGAPGDDSVTPNGGVAYVFPLDGTSPVVTFAAPGATAEARFGSAVAARDGDFLIGAPGTSREGKPRAGRAYLFSGSNGNPLLAFEKPDAAEADDQFGSAVASAGPDVLVSAPGMDHGTGGVFLFDGVNGQPRRGFEHPAVRPGDEFGFAIASDGNRVAVGAPGADDEAGKVFLFDATTGENIGVIESRTARPGDRFGASLAITKRGVLVGASSDNRETTAGGAAYLFDVDTGALLRVFQKDVPSPRDFFATSVDATEDLVVVGAPLDDSGVVNGGAAYLFVGDAIQAVFRKRFTGAAFGSALAGVGGDLLVGAPLDAGGTGLVYRFDGLSGELRSTIASGVSGDVRFGSSIASLGTEVLAGVPFEDADGEDAGAVTLFEGTALRQRIANPAPLAGDQFGFAIATLISSNGTPDVLIGAPLAGPGDVGAAYLFDGISLRLKQMIRKPTPVVGDFFGAAVAGDAEGILVGAPFDSEVAPNAGAAYLFSRTGHLESFFASPSANSSDQFGASVAIVRTKIVVGAPMADAGAEDAGIAFVFERTGTLLATIENPTPANGDQFAASMTAVGEHVLIGAPLNDAGAVDTGAAYLFDGATGKLLQTIPNPTQAALDRFGLSVAGIGSGVLVGAPGPSLAYLFRPTGPPLARVGGIRPALGVGEQCGNGIVEDDEECDDGNEIDTDDCTSNCRRALCCIIDPLAQRRCADKNPCTDDVLDPRAGCTHVPNDTCCASDADCSDGKCRLCNGCFIYDWACCERGGAQCIQPPECADGPCFGKARCACEGGLSCVGEVLPSEIGEAFRNACEHVRLAGSFPPDDTLTRRQQVRMLKGFRRAARGDIRRAQRMTREQASGDTLSKACWKALFKRLKRVRQGIRGGRNLRRCADEWRKMGETPERDTPMAESSSMPS